MAKHRVRCRDCELVFCSSCKHEPYHTGFTCEEMKVQQESQLCRFCGEIVQNGAEVPDVCTAEACQKLLNSCCGKVHECGHKCNGFHGEEECLPCLHADCVHKAVEKGELLEGIDEDEFCTVCWVSELGSEPCIKLGCGHVFHLNCIKNILTKKWTSLRINFGFLNCPSCKQEMQVEHCPELREIMNDIRLKQLQVAEMAVERGRQQGLDQDERLSDPTDHYFGKYEEYAVHKCAFYECFKCKQPYFGGLVDCENDANMGDDTRRQDLICGGCAAEMVGAGVTKCDKHGTDFIDYKCDYCCSIALFFCGGKDHYCDSCHNDAIARRL